jgi:hypothetical protein
MAGATTKRSFGSSAAEVAELGAEFKQSKKFPNLRDWCGHWEEGMPRGAGRRRCIGFMNLGRAALHFEPTPFAH